MTYAKIKLGEAEVADYVNGDSPFRPSRSGDVVYCASCGMSESAVQAFYPVESSYVPTGWKICGGLMHCQDCSFAPSFEFRRTHEPVFNNAGGVARFFEHSKAPPSVVDQITNNDKETPPMKTNDEESEAGFGTRVMSGLGDAALLTGQLTIADQGGELLLDVAKIFAKDIPSIEAMLESPDGRELVKAMMGALLLVSAESGFDFVPRPDLIRKGAKIQMALSGYKLLTPRADAIRKALLAFAEYGSKVGEFTEAGPRARIANVEEEGSPEALRETTNGKTAR